MASDGPRTRENDSRSPRPGGTRSLAAGRRSRVQLATLGAKTAAAIGVGALAVVVVGGLLFAKASGSIRDLERSQYASLAADARVRFDRLVGRDRNRLMDAAFSDGLYELLARGAAPPDSFIRPAFAEQFPGQFGDRFVAIYDLGGRRLYAWADPGHAELETVAGNPLFRVLDNREPAIGLVRQGEKLFWVAGAPILPTNYTAPDQPIRGYLVVAQPFNPSLVGPAGGTGSGRVEITALEPAKEAFRTRVGPAATRDSVRVEFALADIFAQQNTIAAITTSRTEFRLLEGKLVVLAGLGILAIAALAGAGYLAASRFLVAPVARLSQALAPVHAGQTPGLVGSIATATEWGNVVQAVNRLISNTRSVNDHFERLATVVADGAWERDLSSGEWMVTSRFRELVGYLAGEFDTPVAALAARLQPDDADTTRLLAWLEAEVPVPPALSVEVRVRRGAGLAWLRIEGEIRSDGGGLPSRIIGRLSDLTAARAADAEVASAARTVADRRVAEGRFLAAVAPRLVADPGAAPLVAIIGRGRAGTLGAAAAPVDLYGLLQESAGAGELSIMPGVPERVEGDRVLLQRTIALLLDAHQPGSRIVVRADQPDRSRPERIRISVEDRTAGRALDRDAIARIESVLSTGECPDDELPLNEMALHSLAKALGGEAGIEADPAATRRWIIVAMPQLAVTAPTAGLDLANEAWEAGGSEATFDPEPRPDAPARPSRPLGRVELVADATVTINLDDTVPTGALEPIGATFVARLQAGDPPACKAARAALAEIPVRLTGLTGAARTGEIGAVIDGAETIVRIATAIEATEVAARCRDVIDAAESQYLDASDDLIAALNTAWVRLAGVLAPFRSAESVPPIEAATLEQLSASLLEGDLGAQLVGLFLAEGPGRIEAIEEAAGRADWPAVKANAEDLKGMCALIGAAPLAARCAAAIAAVGSDSWTEAMAIRTEWDRVHHVLDGLMGVRTGVTT